ncbi:MAG: EpsG family protein [Ruminococcus sp.]|nr:EpsG family protein [Ruminococcus sp.]
MIIYWSMLLWVPFVYVMYSANRKSKKALENVNTESAQNELFPLSYAILIFAYFTFWIGMRKYIADTGQYISNFNAIPTVFSEAWAEINWEGKDPGWEIFNALFKCYISQDYTWWLMTIAIISMVCILIPLRKYSCDFFFSSFIFIALTTFTWAMNGMRQFVCVAVLFACSHLIKDGKFFKFVVLVLLLSTIHYTCLLMIPVYFVARSKPWQIKMFFFIIAIALVCIFAEPIFAGLEDTVLSNTAYAGATAQFAEDDGVNPLRALFYAVFPVLAYIRRKSLEEYYESNPMLPIAVNMSLISAMLYVVGIFTSGILIGRLPIYCSVYNMILIPYIINYGFNDKDRPFVRLGIIAMMMVMFWMECPSAYHSDLTGWIY